MKSILNILTINLKKLARNADNDNYVKLTVIADIIINIWIIIKYKLYNAA